MKGLFAMVVALLMVGCQEVSSKSAPTVTRTFTPPALAVNEQASQPSAELTPMAEPTAVIALGAPPSPVPPSPVQAVEELPAPKPDRKPSKPRHKPSFVPKRDYPTYEPELLSAASKGPQIHGVPGQPLARDEARPIYHPAVTVQGASGGRQWLDVRFEVLADGSCTAVLLTSTGNAAHDRTAVQRLNSWRWQPRRENGRSVASTEIVRLRRTD